MIQKHSSGKAHTIDSNHKNNLADSAATHAADSAVVTDGMAAATARFPRSPVLFCDFDGTITMNDNIVALMKHFQPPGASEIIDAVIHRRMSIRQGVGAMFALIPSAKRPELESFLLKSAEIRPGFAELLAWCRRRDVPFYVTSGGIDFFVYPLLEPFDIPHDHIFCNGCDFSGEYMKITWPYPCDDECDTDCGMCKATIMRQFPQDRYYRILIGDSVTDFAGAKLADLVFSRSQLTARCQELGLPHVPFETFHDIVRYLDREVKTDEFRQHSAGR